MRLSVTVSVSAAPPVAAAPPPRALESSLRRRPALRVRLGLVLICLSYRQVLESRRLRLCATRRSTRLSSPSPARRRALSAFGLGRQLSAAAGACARRACERAAATPAAARRAGRAAAGAAGACAGGAGAADAARGPIPPSSPVAGSGVWRTAQRTSRNSATIGIFKKDHQPDERPRVHSSRSYTRSRRIRTTRAVGQARPAELRDRVQLVHARDDLRARQALHALGAELLDVERREHRRVGHRPPQQVV